MWTKQENSSKYLLKKYGSLSIKIRVDMLHGIFWISKENTK